MQNPNITPEQQKDIDTRSAAFKEKYKALVEEFQCEHVSYPYPVPLAYGVWGTGVALLIADKKYSPVPVPQEEGITEPK